MMEAKTKKRLVVVGIRRKGERNFKIKIDDTFRLATKENIPENSAAQARL